MPDGEENQSVYYFDGSGGCSLCQEATGYSIGENPGEAHPGCNCPVEQFELPCQTELRNVEFEAGTFMFHETSQQIENCDAGASHPDVTLDEDEEESFDEGMRAAAEAAGWQEPETEAEAAGDMEVPGGQIATLHIQVTRYEANFQAEVWVLCETESGDISEHQAGVATGYYGKNIKFEIELHLEDCPPRRDLRFDDGAEDPDDGDAGPPPDIV